MLARVLRSLYFENGIGCIWEVPEGYLRLEYRPGPLEDVQFRALLRHTAHALSRRQWSKVLVDQRAMDPFNPTEQAWMSTEWLPQAVGESGYRFGAVLVAQNGFARLTRTQLIMATRELTHSYRTFETEETAVAWLLKPD